MALAKRELLLRVHRYRLRREDLEDCFSQATLELVMHVRAGGAFASRRHLANAIELRFLSRVHDRRRALGGRSPMQAALESAASLGAADDAGVEVADARPTVEKLVLLRAELRDIRRLASELTDDQRRVLRSQIAGENAESFRRSSGWTQEKYRKVAQRGRNRLRGLMAEAHEHVPSERPESEKWNRTDL